MEEFLAECGLSQAIGIFKEHEVDLEDLTMLTENQLMILLPKIGHQTKLRRGIKRRFPDDSVNSANSKVSRQMETSQVESNESKRKARSSRRIVPVKTIKSNQQIKKKFLRNDPQKKAADKILAADLYNEAGKVINDNCAIELDNLLSTGWQIINFGDGTLNCPLCTTLIAPHIRGNCTKRIWNVYNYKRHIIDIHGGAGNFERMHSIPQITMDESKMSYNPDEEDVSSLMEDIVPEGQPVVTETDETDTYGNDNTSDDDDDSTRDSFKKPASTANNAADNYNFDAENDNSLKDPEEDKHLKNNHSSLTSCGVDLRTDTESNFSATVPGGNDLSTGQGVDTAHNSVEPIHLETLEQSANVDVEPVNNLPLTLCGDDLRTETGTNFLATVPHGNDFSMGQGIDTKRNFVQPIHSENVEESPNVDDDMDSNSTDENSDTSYESCHKDLAADTAETVQIIQPPVYDSLTADKRVIPSENDENADWRKAHTKFGWVKFTKREAWKPAFLYMDGLAQYVTKSGQLSDYKCPIEEFETNTPESKKKNSKKDWRDLINVNSAILNRRYLLVP